MSKSLSGADIEYAVSPGPATSGCVLPPGKHLILRSASKKKKGTSSQNARKLCSREDLDSRRIRILPIGRRGHHPRSTCFHRSNGQTRRCHPSAGRSAHPPDSVARHRARCSFDRPRIDPPMQVNRRGRKWDGQKNLLRAPSIKTRGIKRAVRSRRVLSSGAIPLFFPPRIRSSILGTAGVNTCPWVRRLFSMSPSQCKTRPIAAILPFFL